jgi:hypothetical protein
VPKLAVLKHEIAGTRARFNEIPKRRTDVVGIIPNESPSHTWFPEQNDEWAAQRAVDWKQCAVER